VRSVCELGMRALHMYLPGLSRFGIDFKHNKEFLVELMEPTFLLDTLL